MNYLIASAFVGMIFINVSLSLLITLSKLGGTTYSYHPASAIFFAEIVKIIISLMQYVQQKEDAVSFPSLSRELLLTYFALAVMYCINNQLTFVILDWTNPGNLTLFKSTTPFLTALLQFIFYKSKISTLRWVSIIILCVGLVLTQWNDCNQSLHVSIRVIALLIVSCLITACSSVLNVEAISSFSSTPLSLQNMVLYTFGAILNLNTYAIAKTGVIPIRSTASFFSGYNNIYAVLVVCLNGCIGIVITILYKYCDAVVKCFAQVLSSIILVIVSMVFFDLEVKVSIICGCICVFVASYTYLVLNGKIEAALQSQNGIRKAGDSDGDLEMIMKDLQNVFKIGKID